MINPAEAVQGAITQRYNETVRRFLAGEPHFTESEHAEFMDGIAQVIDSPCILPHTSAPTDTSRRLVARPNAKFYLVPAS